MIFRYFSELLKDILRHMKKLIALSAVFGALFITSCDTGGSGGGASYNHTTGCAATQGSQSGDSGTYGFGFAGGSSTTDKDNMEVHFLSERALCVMGANNFILMQ